MKLELTPDEAKELARALDTYLAEQDFEMARTDKRAFRHELVLDHTTLETLRKRLDSLISSAQREQAG